MEAVTVIRVGEGVSSYSSKRTWRLARRTNDRKLLLCRHCAGPVGFRNRVHLYVPHNLILEYLGFLDV